MTKLFATTERGNTYSPCRFSKDPVSESYCKELSSLPVRQKQACAACACPFKHVQSAAAPTRQSVTLATSVRPAPAARDVPAYIRPVEKDARPRSSALVPANAPAPVQTKPAMPSLAMSVAVPAEQSRALTVAVTPLVPKDPQPASAAVTGSEPWRAILKRIQIAMADSEYLKISPRLIRPMKGQPREYFDDAALSRLESSVREVGQIQTGLVRRVTDDENGCEFELLDGERRWRVVSRIGEADYRAMLVKIDDEAAPFVVATIANFNRADHTPMELAKAIQRLRHGLGMPMETIADMHGIKQFWAYQLQGLMNLHPTVQDYLDERIMKDKECMPVTAAVHISKLDKDLQPDLARRFMAGEITLRGLRAEVMRLGNEHGKPVRQRKTNPSHQFDSFVSMGRNLHDISVDLKALCNRVDFTSFIRTRDAEKVAAVQRALPSRKIRSSSASSSS